MFRLTYIVDALLPISITWIVLRYYIISCLGSSMCSSKEDSTGMGRDEAMDDCIEMTVFYNHCHRQFVLTGREVMTNQAKPVQNWYLRA